MRSVTGYLHVFLPTSATLLVQASITVVVTTWRGHPALTSSDISGDLAVTDLANNQPCKAEDRTSLSCVTMMQ
jgi:hypothetical protein